RAFPASTFTGFDYHAESVDEARRGARAALVEARRHFATATAKDFPGIGIYLTCPSDTLQGIGEPTGAVCHPRAARASPGTWRIVEPYAADRVEDNFNPVGRAYYAASTLICTLCSLSQEVGLALGAQAGEARTRAVVSSGGFT